MGRTHECDWPDGIETVPVMTRDALGTGSMGSREIHDAIGGAVHGGSSPYVLDVEALERARPDLILTQELCAVCAVSYREVDAAARVLDAPARVVSLEPHSLEDVLAHVSLVGSLTGAPDAAERVVSDARSRLDALRGAVAGRRRRTVFCCEWLDPVFAAGHWVPDQVGTAGGMDPLARAGPSAVIEWHAVVDAAPEVLVLMPCGMPIERTIGELLLVSSRPGYDAIAEVWVVDGSSFFNRPGPRIVRGAEILGHVLHGVGEVTVAEAHRVR